MAILYALSIVPLCAMNMAPAVPWLLLAVILTVVAPLGHFLTELAGYFQERFPDRPRKLRAVCALVGVGVLAVGASVDNKVALVAPICLAAVVHLLVYCRSRLKLLGMCALALLLLYGIVMNLNLTVGPFTLARVFDSEALQWDLYIYGKVLGRPISQAGMYPWLSSHWWHGFFETAYFAFYCEIAVIACSRARIGGSVAGFCATSLAAYLVALAIFCCYPIVGPFYIAPESVAESFRDTPTYLLMMRMNSWYADILAHRPLHDLAYLVGMPSLHVAMAMLMQFSLRRSRAHFWLFAPINVCIALATMYLGFHYVIDFVTGVLLAAVVIGVEVLWTRQVWPRWQRTALPALAPTGSVPHSGSEWPVPSAPHFQKAARAPSRRSRTSRRVK